MPRAKIYETDADRIAAWREKKLREKIEAERAALEEARKRQERHNRLKREVNLWAADNLKNALNCAVTGRSPIGADFDNPNREEDETERLQMAHTLMMRIKNGSMY